MTDYEPFESESGGTRPKQLARQLAISEEVLAAGTIRIDTLADRFGISQMTVHRDLDVLERRGLVRKTRGVATALPSSLFEANDRFRRGQNLDAKRRLARAALAYLEAGQSLILDDSTTSAHMVPLLSLITPVTVITNYVEIMNKLIEESDVTHIGLGGTYHPQSHSYMGGTTLDALRGLRADTLIMSASAVSGTDCYHQSDESVATKRAMFDACDKRILLLDSTKFENRALHRLLPLQSFDVVIVDDATSEEITSDLTLKGVNVERAGVIADEKSHGS